MWENTKNMHATFEIYRICRFFHLDWVGLTDRNVSEILGVHLVLCTDTKHFNNCDLCNVNAYTRNMTCSMTLPKKKGSFHNSKTYEYIFL